MRQKRGVSGIGRLTTSTAHCTDPGGALGETVPGGGYAEALTVKRYAPRLTYAFTAPCGGTAGGLGAGGLGERDHGLAVLGMGPIAVPGTA
jgi:hypothetical protein